ncbi:MAG TPA: protein kinase [Candidatus Polarisedimenticolia bacterium]|nr:protein kinase [Candidatus Polarisedimenticolia bacterium]
MALPPGSRLGPYEILSPLGAGGMGEVYRARDPRLGRDVAIKVLPDAFTQDKERLARFEREAQLLAQLNHPNISSLFGLEESGGVRGLVLELVEGPTLAERLAAGPLPLDDALAVARRIAEALEEAHERGIVHRDLKPANVKLTAGGQVKVLDFGLAKAMDAGGASPSSSGLISQSPTLMEGATRQGVILGTAAYMAPEQAAGAAVDRRADIWSFGVLLYETLTGRRLFEGETVSHILASVLKDTPDFSALPAGTPERIVNLLKRCLRRKPRERLQWIGDARVVIEEVLADPRADGPPSPGSAGPPRPAAPSPRIAWGSAAACLAAAVLFGTLWVSSGGRPASRVLHASIPAPEGMAFGDTFALSPNGRSLVFEAFDRKTGERALWLRDLGKGKASRLDATEGGELPFWSPDGRHVAFFAEGFLKRIDPQGGPARTICEAPSPRGGAWGPDGRIVFSPAFRTGLSIVSSSGGAPGPLTTLDASRGEKSHRFPVYLPGGKRILFLSQTAEGGARGDTSAIEALDLDGGRRTPLVEVNSSPLFDPGGRLLYLRDGALLSVRFDPDSLGVSGDPVSVASPVAYSQNEQALAGISAEGTLVYREGSRGTYSSLVWLDRSGVGMRVIRDRELFDGFALSHDGRRLAYAVTGPGQGGTDLWIHDLGRGSATRLTFEEGSETFPVWSRDDRFLYYANDRRNDGVVYRRPSDGTGAPEEIGTTDQGIWPMDVSADGRWLVAGGVGSQTAFDLFRLDAASREVTPLVATPFLDSDAALSPDESLLAYASEQSGRWEVYVQALRGGQGKWQISTGGGMKPRWRADGREMFYLSAPDRVMAVEVEPGPAPRFSAPRELFRHAVADLDVSPDGQAILGLRPSDSDLNKPLSLISGWPQALPD